MPTLMMILFFVMGCTGITLAYYGPNIAFRSLGEGAAVLFFGLFMVTALCEFLACFGFIDRA